MNAYSSNILPIKGPSDRTMPWATSEVPPAEDEGPEIAVGEGGIEIEIGSDGAGSGNSSLIRLEGSGELRMF